MGRAVGPRNRPKRGAHDKLQRLARGLPQTSPLRAHWERHISQQEVSGTDLLDVLLNIKNSAWREQALGYQLLAQTPLPQGHRRSAARMLRQPFLSPSLFGGSEKDAARAIGQLILFWGSVFLVGIVGSTVPFALSDLVWMIPVAFLGGLFPTLLTSPLVLFAVWLRQTQRARIVQRAAATALAPHGTPYSIEALSHYVSPTSPVRAEVIAALLAILPRVTERWTSHLTSRSHDALLELAAHSEEELALAALDALKTVGPGTAAQAVQRLAKRARSARVRERAAAILPTLVDRAARARDASTLLRPGSDSKTENLLRPVQESDPDTTNLLRASQPELSTTTESEQIVQALHSG